MFTEALTQPPLKDAYNIDYVTSGWQLTMSIITAWTDKTALSMHTAEADNFTQ
jgi:hypothetical protein